MMVPVYALFVYLNLIDSVPGTIFFMAATSLPMAIWMTKNFMDSVPISLEEAAWVDGACAMRALRTGSSCRSCGPASRVVFIFVFTQAWGNFFVPFVLLFSPENQPAAVASSTSSAPTARSPTGSSPPSRSLYSVPVLALYLLVPRLSGGSFALAGAVKG